MGLNPVRDSDIFFAHTHLNISPLLHLFNFYEALEWAKIKILGIDHSLRSTYPEEIFAQVILDKVHE